MNFKQYVRQHLPPLNVPAERETEIVEELALQLETIYERAKAGGANDAEAWQRALAEIPDWAALARTLGRIERPAQPLPAVGAGSGDVMSGVSQDLRYAARSLKRAPGFAAVSILTLALGIAATTVVYSIVDGILLRPLPIRDPDRVMMVRETFNGTEGSVSWLNFEDWQKRQTSFEQFAAWRGVASNLTGVQEPRRLNTRQMTWNMLTVLGVKPIIGRDFTADDDKPGVPRTGIVSYAFWQRELGGNASAIGRQLIIDERPVTVIGVLPAEFSIARQEDLFLPYGNFLDGSVKMFFSRGNHFGLAAIGRLKPGVSEATAHAEMVSIARQLEQEYPETNSGNSAVVWPLFEVLVTTARPMLYVLLGAVITMLLIACVNLANLMLSRAAARGQEMAVRRSLGAARWRIARQMLTESLLLSVVAGTLGVALAYAGFEALIALLPPSQPRLHLITIDTRVLTVAALASIATGLLFGLMPAIQAATGRTTMLLRSSRVTGASSATARTRRMLMLAEVALALILVTGAGLMLRTMSNLLAVDSGVDHEQVISAQFALPPRYDRSRRVVFVEQTLERLKALPGATNAAFTFSLPLAGSNWNSIFIVEGQPVPERSKLPSSAWTPVSHEYFETMGIRLLKGRLFGQTESAESPPVIVVNETFARRLFGTNNPIGARVKQGWPEDKTPWREIVGVVNDVKVNSLQGDSPLQAYIPYVQEPSGFGAFVLRARGDLNALRRPIEAAVREVEPNLPLNGIDTMDDVLEAGVGNERLTMVLLIGFAALALLIAAIGVFGVTAYTVSQRTQEIGVRIALGARPASVVSLVLRQEMGACLIGIAVGIAGALALSSLLESLLFGVTSRDTLTLSVSSLVLLLVTVLACVIPARRATSVDPATALRLE
ncbi:MAG TPA: ABC transporter permease [Vicinamibacterales bacterium]|nr:ABC transporter permease [Vicinamibacterales bacterium]